MNQKAQLPIAVPQYNTYGHQIITTAVFAANPSLKNWALNSLPLLRCNPNFLLGLGTSPEVFISRSGYQDCPFLERKYLSLRFLGQKFHSAIRAMIDEDYYVFFFNMDDTRIRKANRHHSNVFFRCGVIYGYDQTKKTYNILTCNEKWEHSVMEIPQIWLKLPKAEDTQTEMSPSLCAIRPKDTTVELNIRDIYKTLAQYLEESDEENSPFVASCKIYGNIVHEYIAMYLLYVVKKKISYKQIDPRIFRQLWEHKKGMLERLIAVEDTLNLDHDTSKSYLEIVQQAETLKTLYECYCNKRKDKLLKNIREQLLALSKRERSLLSAFMIKIEGEI